MTFSSSAGQLYILNVSLITHELMIYFAFRTGEKARPADVHKISDARTRKRVPLQPLPDPAETDRDRACALPHRAPNQDMVPKSSDEVEKGNETIRTAATGRGAAGWPV